ncbi:MFS transporter [Mitsuaria sp. GD03876]|uniref:spinster family MFS transporter n=1 Tax=Mitsuaria sp. GD03876 TaxID=2975399 RepID=UPI0024479E41|nr:MFS transporter [Mitsuaria sp. GD03876]MDH0867342.1 MFS transporter [Mitsuaria sp. GD03876]
MTPIVHASAPPVRRLTDAPAFYAALIFGAMTLNYLDRSILSVLIIPMKPELQLTDTDIGWLLGFGFALVYAVLGIPLARLADRVGRPLVVGSGMVVWSAATVACGFAGAFAPLLMARIGVGIGEAAGTAPALALVGDQYPKARRPFILGLVNAGASLGTSLGLALGGWIAHLHGWRTAFICAGVPGLLLGLLIVATLRERRLGEGGVLAAAAPARPAAMPSAWESARFVARQRSILLTLAGSVFVGLILMALIAWSPSYFARVHGVELSRIGYTLGLIKGFAGVGGALAGGWLTSRLARRDDRWQSWTPAAALLLLGPVFALFLTATQATVAFAALGIGMFLLSATLGPIYAIYQCTAPSLLRSQVCALHVLVASLGLGCGPLIVGTLNESLFAARGALALQSSLWVLVPAALAAGACLMGASRFLLADIARAGRHDARGSA